MSQVSTNPSAGPSEFSCVSPVSTDIPRPSLSGCSSLPYRQVRTLGSSVQSREALGRGFINEDFRVGGPQLFSLPVWTKPVQRTTPELYHLINESDSLVQEATSILNRFGVQNPDVDICTRHSRLFPRSAPIVTVLILARRDTIDDKWLHAAYEIHDLLLRKDYQNVRVEIIDKNIAQNAGCYPVKESDNIYPVWDEVCKRIIESSDMKDWVSLGCYRYGRDEDCTRNPPAVLLDVKPDSQLDWTPTRNRIVDILDSFDLWDVAVYIMPEVTWGAFAMS